MYFTQILIRVFSFNTCPCSGDHDMVIPYIGTLNWIRLLNLTIDDDWRQWIVDAQVAGLSFCSSYHYIYLATAARK